MKEGGANYNLAESEPAKRSPLDCFVKLRMPLMAKQTINWVINNGTTKPKRHTHYVIKTNWRKAVAYWEKDEDGNFHWMTTEGNSYENTVVSEFAAI